MKKGIKIRWITTTCFEIVLPNGKVIVFDPWCGEPVGDYKMSMDLGFTIDDFTGADYVFLSHTHFDHDADIKELIDKKQPDKMGGHVFMGALSAKLFSEVYDVPLCEIVPVYPYETMDLDDLIVTPLPCRHFGDVGLDVVETPSETRAGVIARGGNPDKPHNRLMEYGTLEEMDWAVTVKENNFRFMILGGRIYRFNNIYKFAEEFNPDFVIRQVSLAATPEAYADMVAKYHAPIVWPSHHDSHDLVKASGLSYEEYFGRVNAALETQKAPCEVVNVKRGAWYNIGVGYSVGE